MPPPSPSSLPGSYLSKCTSMLLCCACCSDRVLSGYLGPFSPQALVVVMSLCCFQIAPDHMSSIESRCHIINTLSEVTRMLATLLLQLLSCAPGIMGSADDAAASEFGCRSQVRAWTTRSSRCKEFVRIPQALKYVTLGRSAEPGSRRPP
ncbi:hypothetical protein K466DRAFT_85620 [Polyporus arcularius HHB13444]|uniref:Uncharacterized protein n=1 Tax=Polyporus arcularius HHB13444 TaxID=1314778 RepID=A0A5C3PEH8_9APHY|nr:hypothetical protein K466DRAFT_85620 [Polyporus arcularius HHB13444]